MGSLRRRALVLAAFALAACDGLVIRLEAGERECFLIDVKAEAAVSGNFELISEVSSKPLTVVVSGEATAGGPLYETVGEPDGTFAFDVGGDGVIDICIANGKKGRNDGLPRTVGFAIRTTVHRQGSDSTSLQRERSARARSRNSIHASRALREMIARPKISRNERQTAEIGAPKLGMSHLVVAQVHHAADEEGSLDALLDVSEELNEGLLTLTDHQAYMRRREENHQHTLASTRTRVFYWTIGETVVLVALSLWQIFYIRGFFETKRML